MAGMIYKVSGSRGSLYFRPQVGEAYAVTIRRLLALLGKPLEAYPHLRPVGFAKPYNEAARHNPRGVNPLDD